MNIIEFNAHQQNYRIVFRRNYNHKQHDGTILVEDWYKVEEQCPNLGGWRATLPYVKALAYPHSTPLDKCEVPQYVFDFLAQPRVLIHKHEYGQTIYRADNTEDASLACLSIFKNEIESGNLDYLLKLKEPKPPQGTREDCIEDQELHTVVKFRWARYDSHMSDYMSNQRLLKKVQRAINEKDGTLAFNVLSEILSTDDDVDFHDIEVVEEVDLAEAIRRINHGAAEAVVG